MTRYRVDRRIYHDLADRVDQPVGALLEGLRGAELESTTLVPSWTEAAASVGWRQE